MGHYDRLLSPDVPRCRDRKALGFAVGALTFALCLGCALTIPIPLVNILIGLIISFIAMTVYNAKYGSPP